MDLLYTLQIIRQACPDWVSATIAAVSESTLLLAPLAACCTYWSVDKKKGTYMICALSAALLLNELIKVTCCVYRPWILDDRLTPFAQVLDTATNYSFPSSHSCAAAVTGTSLVLAFPGGVRRIVIAVICLLSVMFSRMFLGCHTLIDVCVGAGIGVCTAFLLRPMLYEGFDERRFTLWLLPVTLTVTVLVIVYVMTKPYPLDHIADGSLLVDPAKMRPDTIGFCGFFTGIGIGLFLERKFIGFPMPAATGEALTRSAIGFIIIVLLFSVVLKKLCAGLDPSVSKFLRFFISTVVFAAGLPAIIKAGAGKRRE